MGSPDPVPVRACTLRSAIAAAALLVCTPVGSSAAITFQLTITPTSISFPDASPTTSPTVSASSTVAVALRVSGAASTDPWSVGALASGDLVSGGNSIAISNISWTVSGPSGGSCQRPCSCYAGTLSKVTRRVIFDGTANTNNSPICTQTFTMVNSWQYRPGSYAQTVTITATSP